MREALAVPTELHGKVLFLWDGSPLAEQPLGLAAFLARVLGGELVIFRVLLPPRADLVAAPDLSDKELGESHYMEAKEATARLRASCAEEVKASEEVVVVEAAGEPLASLREALQDLLATQIVGRAAKPDIGLVVLGSHGATGEKREPRGGVAVRVVNGTSKPALVVPLLPPPPDVNRRTAVNGGNDGERREV